MVLDADVLERFIPSEAEGATAPRLLVVLAHPDDEVLALGGRLEWLTEARFLCVTDGVPRDGVDARAHGFQTLAEYGIARRAELERALRLAGLDPRCARPLELDGGRPVPDQGAALEMAALARAIRAEIQAFQPVAVLTHPYEGGHPDHDACAFAVHAAVQMHGSPLPLVEAPFYHAGEHGIATGTFVSGDSGLLSRLTPDQQRKKQQLLACFESQAETLQMFPAEEERYRAAPAYAFDRRPHEGQLYYERFPWGMDGDRFCQLAAAARRELGL